MVSPSALRGVEGKELKIQRGLLQRKQREHGGDDVDAASSGPLADQVGGNQA